MTADHKFLLGYGMAVMAFLAFGWVLYGIELLFLKLTNESRTCAS